MKAIDAQAASNLHHQQPMCSCWLLTHTERLKFDWHVVCAYVCRVKVQ